MEKELKKQVQELLDDHDFGVDCLKVTRDGWGGYIVTISENIYYKVQMIMEAEIFALGKISNIYYKDVI